MAHFTSKSEIELLVGARGVSLRLDDQSVTTGAVEQALIFADQTIRFYTDQFYNHSYLVGNAWVKNRATYIAANALSNRRGNKELFGAQVARIMDELALIGTRFWIPDAMPLSTNVPSVRNQKAVGTFGPRPLKVDEANSTGGGYSDEDFGWFNNVYDY